VRIASIGECMVELRHLGERELELGFGGDTLNTATYLARLGGPEVGVSYVTALGDDPYSEAMLETWRAEGIDVGLIARLPGRLPGLYMIRTDERGERSFHYWRSAAAARDMLRTPEADRVLAALAGFDLLYLSGITLSILDRPQRERLLALVEAVRGRGGRIAFDSNYRPGGWPDADTARAVLGRMTALADVALPTLEDERRLFGDTDAAACAERLRGQGVAEVAVKQGEHGCHLASDGFTGPVPAERVGAVVDSTAAGDSFNAGYLVARLRGVAPEEAARVGNRLAARVIRHRGAVIPRDAMADMIA
jgi:2-dehydro-3-deoxygluconokinase